MIAVPFVAVAMLFVLLLILSKRERPIALDDIPSSSGLKGR